MFGGLLVVGVVDLWLVVGGWWLVVGSWSWWFTSHNRELTMISKLFQIVITISESFPLHNKY